MAGQPKGLRIARQWFLLPLLLVLLILILIGAIARMLLLYSKGDVSVAVLKIDTYFMYYLPYLIISLFAVGVTTVGLSYGDLADLKGNEGTTQQ